MWSFQVTFKHSLRLSGMPCLQRMPRSAKPHRHLEPIRSRARSLDQDNSWSANTNSPLAPNDWVPTPVWSQSTSVLYNGFSCRFVAENTLLGSETTTQLGTSQSHSSNWLLPTTDRRGLAASATGTEASCDPANRRTNPCNRASATDKRRGSAHPSMQRLSQSSPLHSDTTWLEVLFDIDHLVIDPTKKYGW